MNGVFVLKHLANGHNAPTYEDMIEYNMDFWEHFTDHLLMVSTFVLLGYMLTIMFVVYLHNNKFKIDYELERGRIMRVYHNGKKWLIVNPKTTVEWFDILLLIYFDKKQPKAKYIDQQDKKRIKNVRIVALSIIIIAIIWGVIMLFSASTIDVNPFNWLRGYRPWNHS
jgi:hypothetical protein